MADISTTEITGPQLLKGFQPAARLASRLMAKDPSDPREVEFLENLAWRLKLAVEALGVPKGEVADAIGVSQQRLSNWMTNQNRPDWFGVAKLCERFGISADWILLGKVDGLKHSLAESLARASAGRSEAPKAEGRPAPEAL